MVVSDLLVQDFGCLIETLIKAAITTLLDVSLIRLADELLKIG
jgi:hypothetical protein